MEMEEAASTNLAIPFYHRMAHDIAQDAFSDKCHKSKYVLPGIDSKGRKAGEMSKVRAQTFLHLITWSE
jgi:hypothetical protein